jgi:predicted transglutaminase-like cysteine proteinase
MLTAGRTAGAEPALGLFGSLELRKNSLKTFPKWTDMLARNARDMGDKPVICSPDIVRNCIPKRWQAFIAQSRHLDQVAQLQYVNNFINGRRYVRDVRAWGIKDYWATPRQFLTNNGDCEDFAIAKYIALKSLGMDPAKMRIVVLQDMRRQVTHAVLAVYTGNGVLILDNLSDQPVWASSIRHYLPIFSINEDAWWYHENQQRLAVLRDDPLASDYARWASRSAQIPEVMDSFPASD